MSKYDEFIARAEASEPGDVTRREKFQKEFHLKKGDKFYSKEVFRCRKIFYSCGAGTLGFKIVGDHNLEGTIQAGYEGGPRGPGGGAYMWKDIQFSMWALSDAHIYLHIEWIRGAPEWTEIQIG